MNKVLNEPYGGQDWREAAENGINQINRNVLFLVPVILSLKTKVLEQKVLGIKPNGTPRVGCPNSTPETTSSTTSEDAGVEQNSKKSLILIAEATLKTEKLTGKL